MSKENTRGSKIQISYLFQRLVPMYQPKYRLIFNIPLQRLKLRSQGVILGIHLVFDETAQLNCGRWELLPAGLPRKGKKCGVASFDD
jgi:hypothetical protein